MARRRRLWPVVLTALIDFERRSICRNASTVLMSGFDALHSAAVMGDVGEPALAHEVHFGPRRRVRICAASDGS
jgi:hypothetical protein